jgi:hypothetical protein
MLLYLYPRITYSRRRRRRRRRKRGGENSDP